MATKNKPSSKKTSGKRTNFLSRINLASRKTQFVATILVIAIIGAGYYTYQSFAATGSWTYTPANGALQVTSGGSGIIKTVSEPAKNSAAVYEIPARRNSAVGKYQYFQIPGTFIPANQEFNVCLTAKGLYSNGVYGMVYNFYATRGHAIYFSQSRSVANQTVKSLGNGYYQLCSNNQKAGYNLSGTSYLTIDWQSPNSEAVRISSMSIEFINSAPVAPAPAPAK